MIIKTVGFALVMLSSVLMGVYFANRTSFRIKDLMQMKKGFTMLKQEIEYSLTPLPMAMDNISKKLNEPVSSIFGDFYMYFDEHKKIGISQIWIKTIENNASSTYFEEEDISNFKQFGNTLGYLDKSMEISNIDMIVNYIDEKVKELQEVSAKDKKLYTSLGVLCGIMVCVFFI